VYKLDVKIQKSQNTKVEDSKIISCEHLIL